MMRSRHNSAHSENTLGWTFPKRCAFNLGLALANGTVHDLTSIRIHGTMHRKRDRDFVGPA